MLSRFAWVAVFACVVACGGKSENDGNGSGGGPSGGSGGTTGGTGGIPSGGSGGIGGGSGGSGGSGTGGVPPTCEVATSQAPPYATIIRFTTTSTTPLYLVDSCDLEWSLFACADGYTTSLGRSGACTVDCGDPSGGCIACGACQYLAKPVVAGTPVDDEWSGDYFTYGETPDGCSCHEKHSAPPAKYRAAAKVYASEDDVQNGVVLREVSVDFELPAPGDIVEVSLD
jgi:hypothetical protein